MVKKVYVLHESGSDSHYLGLKYLLESHNQELHFREFSVVKGIVKSIIRLDQKLFRKQLVNLFFLFGLLFSKNKKVVLGIAPFNFRLQFLLFCLRQHKIYYHSSWTNWRGDFVPRDQFATTKVKEVWRRFIEHKTKHLFVVTEKAKEELQKYYKVPDNKISVVFHAFKNDRFVCADSLETKPIKFIFSGRLVAQKGVVEVLEYFKNLPEISLTIVGKGPLQETVEDYALTYANIEYKGYLQQEQLVSEYQKHHYLVLNSKKIGIWEELFGLVIIEAMACGTVPIASAHPGPYEIIKEGCGYLFKEENFKNTMENVVKEHNNYQVIRENAIRESRKYCVHTISKTWKSILV